MAEIRCKGCGIEVNGAVSKCPACGTKLGKTVSPLALMIAGLIVAAAILALFGR